MLEWIQKQILKVNFKIKEYGSKRKDDEKAPVEPEKIVENVSGD